MTVCNMDTLSENKIILDKIINIVSTLSVKKEGLLPETKIIQEGYIDSLSIFNIILNLEKAFSIRISPMDATVKDFETPASIAKLIFNLTKKN